MQRDDILSPLIICGVACVTIFFSTMFAAMVDYASARDDSLCKTPMRRFEYVLPSFRNLRRLCLALTISADELMGVWEETPR